MHEAGPAIERHVVITGGGFAALETALALRALAGDRVRLTLIAPDSTFAYRPAATAEAFRDDWAPLTYDLPRLLAGIDARHERSRVAAVLPQSKEVRLETGAQLAYDALVIAIGARSHAAVPGAFTFRDQRDVPHLRTVLEELESRAGARLVFAIPSCNSWPLPAYELALTSASHFAGTGSGVEVTVVSAERAPLDVFGPKPSRLLSDLLAERQVRFLGGVIARSVNRTGELELEFEAPLPADSVIAIPELRGVRIPGVPARWFGFVPTDTFGRVEGLADVYAAGDITTFPIKQGGLAAQQADHVAHMIASTVGVPLHEARPSRVLQARLLDGDQSLFLRCQLDDFGQPVEPMTERVAPPDARPEAKVFARYLAPYLAQHESIGSLRAA